MLLRVLCVLCLVSSVLSLLGVGSQQSVEVRGRLQCNGKPYRGALVKLYNENTLGKDDRLGKMTTGNDGNYKVGGHARELTKIDPKINIYHDCNDGIKPCQRKFSIGIPKMYINSGKVASKIYDAGTLELAGKYPGESRDCLH